MISSWTDCAWLDTSLLAEIRQAAISTKWDRVRAAALMLSRKLLTADCARDLSAELKKIVSAMIYAYSGEIRHEAAMLLADCGDRRFEKLVTGAFADFGRLAKVPAPEHEEAIRAILATNLPDRHAAALREILYSRATFRTAVPC